MFAARSSFRTTWRMSWRTCSPTTAAPRPSSSTTGRTTGASIRLSTDSRPAECPCWALLIYKSSGTTDAAKMNGLATQNGDVILEPTGLNDVEARLLQKTKVRDITARHYVWLLLVCEVDVSIAYASPYG